MPKWLLAALGVLTGAGVATGAAKLGGGGIPFLPAAIDPFEPGGLKLPDFLVPRRGKGEEENGKRRRRRRALTQSDRNDIAFIAGIIGKTAAGSFAIQLATRSR